MPRTSKIDQLESQVEEILESVDAATAPPMERADAIEILKDLIGQLQVRIDGIEEDIEKYGS